MIQLIILYIYYFIFSADINFYENFALTYKAKEHKLLVVNKHAIVCITSEPRDI